MVQQRMKETGATDEKLVRSQINREQRAKKKERKASKHVEVEKIKIEVQTTMAGKDKKVIDKAVKRAIATYFSKLKKSKNPQHILKQKANDLIHDVNSQLWCPSDQGWWDGECQQRFDEIELLAAMWEINLLKAPQNFGKLYPAVCKKYFDFLAKKRFNSTKESEDKNTEEKLKKSKSSLQKRFDEKKAQNTDPQKNDKDILKEVLDEMNKKEKEANLSNLKRIWKPAHKPFFDQECRDAFDKLTEQAVTLGCDLESKVGDYKKFKVKNKAEVSTYFQLLQSKRTAFNKKQKSKEEARSAMKTKPSNVDDNANETSENQVEKVLENQKTNKVETEADVDETIDKVERELKKKRRKEAKLAKKLKLKKEKENFQDGTEVTSSGTENQCEIPQTEKDSEKEDSNEKKPVADTVKSKKEKIKKEKGEVLLPETGVIDKSQIKGAKQAKKRKNKESSDPEKDVSSVKKEKKKKSVAV